MASFESLRVCLNLESKLVGKKSKCIKNVLPYIISESQTVYVNRRFISKGGRLIDDLPEICDVFNRQGSLVTIDIEKASNSVSINLL